METEKPGTNGDYDICHLDIQDVPESNDFESCEKFALDFCKFPSIYICLKGVETLIPQTETERLKDWIKEQV